MSTVDTAGTARPARAARRAADPAWFRWLATSPAAARTVSLVGVLLGVAALVYEPLLFGAFGTTAGLLGKHAGDRLGRYAVAVAMTGLIVGPVLSSTVYALLVSSP